MNDHIDPAFVRLSLGNFGGEAKQFGVRGNSPDPATVGVAAGLIKYELVPWQYYNSQTGQDWDRSEWEGHLTVRNYDANVMGTVLVQMIEARKLKCEAFPGKRANEISGFGEQAAFYER